MHEYQPAGANGDVALLIDFWNLTHGVENDVDCEALFRFAGSTAGSPPPTPTPTGARKQ